MVFIPFTKIKNHREIVTVGVGLLSNETIESYTWLLNSFIRASRNNPQIIVTDQDPTIRKVIATFFKCQDINIVCGTSEINCQIR